MLFSSVLTVLVIHTSPRNVLKYGEDVFFILGVHCVRSNVVQCSSTIFSLRGQLCMFDKTSEDRPMLVF